MGVQMRSSEPQARRVRTGWSTVLAKAVAAIFVFEIISGLAITLGPFHPAIQWGLLLHTIAGVITIAPLAFRTGDRPGVEQRIPTTEIDGLARQVRLLTGYLAPFALFGISPLADIWRH